MASEEAAGCSTVSWRNSWTCGPELLRQLFQDRLDATAAREERRHDVAGKTAWCARARKKAGNGRW